MLTSNAKCVERRRLLDYLYVHGFHEKCEKLHQLRSLPEQRRKCRHVVKSVTAGVCKEKHKTENTTVDEIGERYR